ncbi:MAG TPA: histidine kinase, partial [Terriglobales bacterium]|nr:histidine kinase [Terriglobales bacterium]
MPVSSGQVAARTRRIMLAYAGSFAVFALLTLISAFQAYSDEANYGLARAGFTAYLSVPAKRFLIYALLAPTVFWMVRRRPFSRAQLAQSFVLYGAAAIAFTLAVCAIRLALFPRYFFGAGPPLPRTLATLWQLARDNFIVTTYAAYLPMVAVAHAVELRNVARRSQLEEAALSRAVAEQQLQLLKMHLHPHFLFNTLQGIRTLVRRNPQAADEMLSRLRRLLQSAVQHDHS